MDLTSVIRPDVFGLLTRNIVPGIVAMAPWLFMIFKTSPAVAELWGLDHAIVYILFGTAILVAGLIIEELGTFIENEIIDPTVEYDREQLLDEWQQYLKLRSLEDAIGQHYLRGVVVRLKFELTTAPAVLIGGIGTLASSVTTHEPSMTATVLIMGVAILLFMYLLSQAKISAQVLANTRKLLLEANSPVGPQWY
jgi:hypothetical protein